MDADLERIKKLENQMSNYADAIKSFSKSIGELKEKTAELEHNMIFLLDLGIEKHIADHNREMHARELNLDKPLYSGEFIGED